VITIVDLGGGWLPNDLTLAGWSYHAAATQPPTFFDVTSGNNDIAGIGC
jgi:hypothetical protein